MAPQEFIGARIAFYRTAQNLTQGELAARAGVSRSHLAAVETNPKRSPSATFVGQLANGLGIDASKLYADDEPEQLLEIMPIIRRALAAIDLMDDDLEPEPIEDLRPKVLKLGEWRRATQYRKITNMLPDLTDRLLVTAREEGEPAYALLTDTYRAANTLAHKMGYSDLSMTATERMVWAAERSGDPLLLATVHYLKAATLARIGAVAQASRLLDRAMVDIEPLVGDSPRAAAVMSTLHMRAGTIAASQFDADTSRSHLAEAARLAEGFPEGVVYDTQVGETNVKLFKMNAEIELGNPERAVELARTTKLPAGLAVERQTYFWLDAARAHLLNNDPDAAMEALFESQAVAPEHFMRNPTVKVTVVAAGEHKRRASRDFQRLASLAGLGK
ncbi:helix-turn-helix domain-containing protein [Nocardia brasiliensis]|uniref:helix-turn-helix domain-containing protein n=1 Tax=Nocardia brasiliensis TaxID=37326 RepID=UPI0037B0C9DD